MKQRLTFCRFLLIISFITISYDSLADLSVQLSSDTHHGYNIRCFGGQDGNIHVEVTGGTPPYEIYMNGDLVSADITQLPAGTYSFIVYDTPLPNHSAELPGEGWITLTEPTPLQLNTTPHVYGNNFNVSCYYCHDGYVTLNGQGGVSPYNYLWFDYSTNQTHYSLGTGSYSAIITDANGCEAHVDNFFLSAPSRDDWTLLGNSGIDSTKFMGTTDNKDFVLKTNGTERMRIKSSGNLEVSSLAGAEGMVYVDSDGELQNGTTTLQNPCGNPVKLGWQAYASPQLTLFTCPQIKVGVGIYSPATNFHVVGNSVFTSSSTDINSAAMIQGNNNMSSASNPEYTWWNNTNTGLFHPASNAIGFSTSGSERIRIDLNGKIGIGTQTPTEKLHVEGGSLYIHGEGGGLIIDEGSNKRVGFVKYGGKEAGIWRVSSQDFEIGRVNVTALPGSPTTFTTDLYIDGNGKVGIAAIPPASSSYNLFVGGGIATRDVKIIGTTAAWPDYVFNKDYHVISIYELEQFIKKYKHLPEMPSAKEIESNEGFEIGDMQIKFLQKIEEQTLYIIDLQKQIDELKLLTTHLIKK